MKNIVIIPAAGNGLRLGEQIPKQYLKVFGKEIIAYTIDIFQNCGLIDEIIISAQTEYFDQIRQIKDNYGFTKISKVVKGGETRQKSVANALFSITAEDSDLILIHDAARPLLPKLILKNAIEKAKIHQSAIVAIKAKDTLLIGNSIAEKYIPRENVFYVQTPQIFSFKILKESFIFCENTNFIATDDSSLVKNAGFDIHLVEGSEFNFKITTATDLEIFKKIVNSNN